MRWLRRDEGIVLILVGLLLVVLLGMAGLAVDLGALYSERRQLRNGADAAALAIAEDCGTGAKACDYPTAQATAQMYADDNSDSGAPGVVVYLTGTGTAGTVEVVTSTVVRVPLMGPLNRLHGEDDLVTVTATATAIFDHPLSATGLALAVRKEQYQVGNQKTLYPWGWLQPDAGSECWATVTAEDWSPGEADFGCTAQYLRNYVYDKDVLIPLFQGDPHDSEYWIAGFAYFHVTGYDFGHGRTYPLGFSCHPSDPEDPWQPCLRGYFTPSRTLYSGTPGGPEDYGLVLVKLTN